jgi:DNA-binding NtrC family response regulator
LSQPARILVIDDDENVRKTFAIILEENGYIVDTAQTGKEAVEKSCKNFYNAALIDIRLPDMEGTKILSSLQETSPRMVKIIVTGFPTLKNAVEAVNKGADGYVLKPPNMKEFLEMLKEHLRKQQQEKNFTEDRVTEFIQRRIAQIEKEDKPV